MKKKNFWVATALILASLLFLVISNTVPTPNTNPVLISRSVQVPSAISELVPWLKHKEAKFSSLKPWAAKKILWSDPAKKNKTNIALVYLHGYSATRKEISPSVEDLASEIGANVFFTRYTGCGLTQDPEKGVTLTDWLKDTLEALKIGELIGDHVVLIGTSTGGTLAAWLALSSEAPKISAIILTSPNLTPKNSQSEMLLWPGNQLIVHLVLGSTMSFKPQNSLQAAIWDYRHSTDSLIPMMQIVNVVRHQNFSKWQTPTLLFFSHKDKVVNEKVTAKLFKSVSSNLLETVIVHSPQDPDAHVLSGLAKSPNYTAKWVARSKAFLERVMKD